MDQIVQVEVIQEVPTTAPAEAQESQMEIPVEVLIQEVLIQVQTHLIVMIMVAHQIQAIVHQAMEVVLIHSHLTEIQV